MNTYLLNEFPNTGYLFTKRLYQFPFIIRNVILLDIYKLCDKTYLPPIKDEQNPGKSESELQVPPVGQQFS